MSKLTGLNKKTIRKSLDRLESLGLIRINRRKTKVLMIYPTIPKNGPSQNTTRSKNGTPLGPKTDQNYTQNRYPNIKGTIKEQELSFDDDERNENPEAFLKALKEHGAGNLMEAVLNKKGIKDEFDRSTES